MSDDDVTAMLTGVGAADLVTATPEGLRATLLPFVYADGTLRGHLARNNDQWRLPVLGEAMVIVRGPDAYVSPSWYATKAEHGRVVPTWNYVTAHVYGEVTFHDSAEWVERVVRDLTAKHENGRARPWAVDDAPERFIAGQLRAIVGVEVAVSRVEAKRKASQNRSEADRAGVAAGLAAEGDAAMAREVYP
ncbi:transcriptional regulator [Actinokineospora fastidiosa]|uniref:Transcriptional regulator n=2 Tax=Pseudonocardiaceae TaxID=2070 RepID=A0A918LE56_9PSEU|nr:transcriptional regulator [Actinokineospora fastidiosa]